MTKMASIAESYSNIRAGIVELLKRARSATARNVNFDHDRRVLGNRTANRNSEQGGAVRASYGDELIKQLANDLSAQFGRGFGVVNLSQMRRFFLAWPAKGILQTPSEQSLTAMLNNDIWESLQVFPPPPANQFPFSWFAYVRLLSVKRLRPSTE